MTLTSERRRVLKLLADRVMDACVRFGTFEETHAQANACVNQAADALAKLDQQVAAPEGAAAEPPYSHPGVADVEAFHLTIAEARANRMDPKVPASVSEEGAAYQQSQWDRQHAFTKGVDWASRYNAPPTPGEAIKEAASRYPTERAPVAASEPDERHGPTVRDVVGTIEVSELAVAKQLLHDCKWALGLVATGKVVVGPRGHWYSDVRMEAERALEQIGDIGDRLQAISKTEMHDLYAIEDLLMDQREKDRAEIDSLRARLRLAQGV